MMERPRNPHATARSVAVLSGLSALSPLAGLAVEMALAWGFGASATVDAFRIGSLLMLFGQQLFVDQILPNVIVPLFAEYRAQAKGKEAWCVAFSLANLLFIPIVLVSLFLFVFPDSVVGLLGPGLAEEARATAVLFIRWFALAYIPLVWCGMAAGLLYAHGIFWLPVASQLLSNMVLVIVILAFGRGLGPASLVFGVLLATLGRGALYAARLVPLIRRAEVRFSFQVHARHPGVRKALRLALPLLGTLVLGQWSAIVVNRVLSELPTGTLATFGYAWKMLQLVSLLPAALATVLLPRFAESWYVSGESEFREVCTRALRMALFIAIPLTCIFFMLRVPLVAMLFQRGKFSPEAGEMAARLFGLLLLGGPASVAYVFLEKMLYAVQEMRVPTYVALAGALFLTAIAPAVGVRFGAEGLAVVCGALPWLTVGGVLFILCQRYRALRVKGVGMFVMGILPLAFASAWLGDEAGRAFGQLFGFGTLSLGLTLASGLLLAITTFYGVTLLLGFPEALQGRRYVRRQRDVMVMRVQNALRG